MTYPFKQPVTVNDHVVVSFSLRTLSFGAFIELARRAQAKAGPKVALESMVQRERMAAQVVFHTADGQDVTMTPDQLVALPASVALQIMPKYNVVSDSATMGEVIGDGDGMTTPILYKLGTSIKAKLKGENIEIAEIEFIAKTYGDIEDVLSGQNELYQTMELITKLAKPVVGSLMSLPSWAINQITIADGVAIQQKVLPAFLPKEESSANESSTTDTTALEPQT